MSIFIIMIKLSDILKENQDPKNLKGAVQLLKGMGIVKPQFGKAGQVRGSRLNLKKGGVEYRLPLPEFNFVGMEASDVEAAKQALTAGGWKWRQMGPSVNYITITGYTPQPE